MAQKTVYEFTPEVAFQFYNLKYPQEETRSTMKASMPGLDVTEEESEAAGAVGNNIAQATQQQAAGGAAAPPEAAAEVGAGEITRLVMQVVPLQEVLFDVF